MNTKSLASLQFIVIFIIASIAGAASGLGATQVFSKNPDNITDQAPEPLAAPEGLVASAFTYQGILRENGVVVNGSRTMTFRLYNEASCTSGLLATTTPASVPVTNGLFNAVVPFDHQYFNGQVLWISADVGGTVMGCQEALPVPYAMSLRPGATISSELDTPLLILNNDSMADTGSGLSATSHGNTAAAVIGESTSLNGTGVLGRNYSDGYAMYSDGPFGSSEEIKLSLNPYDLAQPGDPNLTFTRLATGAVDIYSSFCYCGAELPLTVPSILFGSPLYLAELHVFYSVTGDAIINDTRVVYGSPGGVSYYINDSTDRGAAWVTEYTLYQSTPRVGLDYSSYIQFVMNFNENGHVYIYKVQLVLTESQY